MKCYSCDECEMVYASNSALSRHKKWHKAQTSQLTGTYRQIFGEHDSTAGKLSIVSETTEHSAFHKLVTIPATESKKRPQKRCRVCWMENRTRKDTRFMCLGCEDLPGLCSPGHFNKYHQKLLSFVE